MSPMAAQPPRSTRSAARSLFAPPSLRCKSCGSGRRCSRGTSSRMRACDQARHSNFTPKARPPCRQTAKARQAQGGARNDDACACLHRVQDQTETRGCSRGREAWDKGHQLDREAGHAPPCCRTFQSVTKAAPSSGMPAPHEKVMADTRAACSGRAKLSTSARENRRG